METEESETGETVFERDKGRERVADPGNVAVVIWNWGVLTNGIYSGTKNDIGISRTEKLLNNVFI